MPRYPAPVRAHTRIKTWSAYNSRPTPEREKRRASNTYKTPVIIDFLIRDLVCKNYIEFQKGKKDILKILGSFDKQSPDPAGGVEHTR